jgi:hypothetical protein
MPGEIARIKSLFFDQAAVQKAADKATRKNLSMFGAFVRTRARSSIRTRSGTSRPGEPPHSHSGLVRRFLFFSFDPSSQSVVIGPARLNGAGKGEAPEALEHGGRVAIKRRGKTIRPTIAPRPFMGPAFEKEKTNLPAIWANSIKG